MVALFGVAAHRVDPHQKQVVVVAKVISHAPHERTPQEVSDLARKAAGHARFIVLLCEWLPLRLTFYPAPSGRWR